jgi:hypothetical protein
VSGGKHFTDCSGFEDPPLRLVAGAPAIGGNAGPIEMHVDGQRSGCSVVSEPALLLRHIRE